MDTNTTSSCESTAPSTSCSEIDPIRNPESEIRDQKADPQSSTLADQITFPRSPGESPRAYSAFLAYFQLGHSRSLQSTADKLDESIDTVKKWSSKFNWSDRIQSFNAGILQQQAESEAASQREQAAQWSARFAELRQQEWTAAQKLLSVVQFYLESCGDEQLEKMTLSQVGRALSISSSISRLAISRADQPEKDEPKLSPIQLQLTEALKRAFGNPAPHQPITN